jgi:hypothetical protein
MGVPGRRLRILPGTFPNELNARAAKLLNRKPGKQETLSSARAAGLLRRARLETDRSRHGAVTTT